MQSLGAAHGAVAGFNLGGFRVQFTAPSETLLTTTRELLDRFAIADLSGDWCRIRIDQSAAPLREPVADGLQLVWEGEVKPQGRARHWAAAGRRRVEFSGVGRMDLDLDRGQGTITLEPTAKECNANYFLLMLVHDGLSRHRHYPAHAACLAMPTANGWRSVLIVAPSGTGKSTTSLALTDSGWKLMGDDVSVVSFDGEQLGIWGFPRECHIRRPTLAMLPWLDDLPLVPGSVEGTFNLPLADLGPRSWEGHPSPLPPALIVCLNRPNPERHKVERLDRASALLHISQENVLLTEGPTDPYCPRAFEALATLVRRTPTCALSAGPDLTTLAECLLGHMAA